MTPIIEVKGLSKKYQIGEQQPYLTLRDSLASLVRNPFKKIKEGLNKDEFWALKDINFTVEPGEVVGIIGRNGAGKSTLLKILSRITPPTTGEITLRGRVGSLLEVGTGFQQELTGRENIYLNGAILGMSQVEIKRKFDEIVAFAEVEKFIDTPVKHYSSGMYMRLAFSIAAHLDPEILIVDEVLAVGDAEFQKKCLGKMDEVSKKQGKTVLFVSHNINAIEYLCNKCIYLESGSSCGFDNTDLIINKYIQSTAFKKIINLDNKYIKKLTIQASNPSSQLIRISDPLIIDVSIDISGVNEYQVALEIRDVSNSNIFWLYDHLMQLKCEDKSIFYNFKIDHLNLYPGKYYIGIWVGKKDNKEIYYQNNNFTEFIVHENKDLNYYRQFGEGETKIFQKFSWGKSK